MKFCDAVNVANLAVDDVELSEPTAADNPATFFVVHVVKLRTEAQDPELPARKNVGGVIFLHKNLLKSTVSRAFVIKIIGKSFPEMPLVYNHDVSRKLSCFSMIFGILAAFLFQSTQKSADLRSLPPPRHRRAQTSGQRGFG